MNQTCKSTIKIVRFMSSKSSTLYEKVKSLFNIVNTTSKQVNENKSMTDHKIQVPCDVIHTKRMKGIWHRKPSFITLTSTHNNVLLASR